MEFRVPYGKSQIGFSIPDTYTVEWIGPELRNVKPYHSIQDAIENPLGAVPDLRQVKSVAIAFPDKTRPMRPEALFTLLRWLHRHDLWPEAITILIATGTHTPMKAEDYGPALTDAAKNYRVISHDCDDVEKLAYYGETTRGTPVWVNREFVRADLRVVIGNIEPHQFMGFSGGVKSAAIGLTGRETINRNHALMVEPGADLGRYEDNPVRQDVEEIGRMIGVNLAINTILDFDKDIAHVFAGDPVDVMKAGIPLVRKEYEIQVETPFDVVITAPGGHPKDINLYQAQKALSHASRVTKDGGTVILVAACPEGTGNARYEQWIKGMTSHEAVLERFAQEEFRLGPHKAFQIARDAVRIKPLIKSEMADEFVRSLLLTPIQDVTDTLQAVLRDLPDDARIGVIPIANATIPVLCPKP